MHWSSSQCLVLQGAVPTWLPPEVILFPLAARNSQWVYQDSVKYHSVVHLSKAFIWLLNIHIKICLQVVDGSLHGFGVKRLQDIGFRKKRRQTKGRPTSVTPDIANTHFPGSLPVPPLIPLRNGSGFFCYKFTGIIRMIDILSRLINSCLINYSLEHNS